MSRLAPSCIGCGFLITFHRLTDVLRRYGSSGGNAKKAAPSRVNFKTVVFHRAIIT